jgi:hypothetical protein
MYHSNIALVSEQKIIMQQHKGNKLQSMPTSHGIKPSLSMPTSHGIKPGQSMPTSHGIKPGQSMPTSHGIKPGQSMPTSHGIKPGQSMPTSHGIKPGQLMPTSHGIKPGQLNYKHTFNAPPCPLPPSHNLFRLNHNIRPLKKLKLNGDFPT